MGVAVFEGTSLLHHTVASIERRQTLHAIMSEARATGPKAHHDLPAGCPRLREDLRRPEPKRGSPEISCPAELLALGKKANRLEVLAVAPSTVKKFMTGNGFRDEGPSSRREFSTPLPGSQPLPHPRSEVVEASLP